MANKYNFPSLRLDASESAFLSRQLVHIRAAAFEVQYPQLTGRQIVPMVSDQPHPGAEKYEYNYYNSVGKVVIGRSYDDDAPRADIYAGSDDNNIFGIRNSYGYNIQEMRAAQMAGLPLSARKARAARDVMEKNLDDYIWDGVTDLGLEGMAALSGTCTYAVPAGAGGTTWALKTPDEIVADLNGIVDQIRTDTNEVENPDTLVVPATSYRQLTNTRMGDGSDTTILTHFLAVNQSIKQVQSSLKLETAGGGSTRRMIAFEKNPDKLGLLIPQEFEQFAPQAVGMGVVVQCHMRFGGIALFFPKSVCYGDGI